MHNLLFRLAVLAGALGLVAGKPAAGAGANWYYDHWCGGNLEYLDDGKCVKLFPAETADREWSCAVPSTSAPTESGFQVDTILADVSVDTMALNGVVNDPDVNLCVIVTQRVANASAPSGVTLYNKYLCAGDYSETVAYETWSSSKVFAVANAAGHLRTNETSCGEAARRHLFGVDGSVTGKHGLTLLGDLATVICSYDQTAGYSSNSLSSYFHDLGWRDRINTLVQDWLLTPGTTNRPSDLPQTLGGNYGEATPSDLTLDVTAHTPTTATTAECAAEKDPWPVVYSNSLSALSAAELVRRLALHRELPQSLRFPGATWRDVQTILYGAEQSAFFPGQVWGGMTADTAVFTQAALDLPSLLLQWDPATKGQWRLFSKLGAGYSSSRSRGEIVSNAYACLPRYDAAGAAVVGGLEFTVAARGSVPYDSALTQVQAKLHQAMDRALQYVLANYAR